VAAAGARLLDSSVVGNGRFQLVLDGSVESDGKPLSKHTVGYVSAGDRFSKRVAGPAGVHMLELQFPKE
jgi:hypothetical protein